MNTETETKTKHPSGPPSDGLAVASSERPSGSDSAVDINRNIGDFSYDVAHAYDAGTGLSEKTVHYISDVKEDPDWVREFRLRGLKTFLEKPMPTHWASKDLEAIDFDKIR